MPVARLEITPPRHLHRLRIGKRHTQPRVVRIEMLAHFSPQRIGLQPKESLYLKLEQSPRTQQPVHFAHISLDHLAARDVLKHDDRIREVKFQLRHYRQIAAVILIHVRVREILESRLRARDHLAAHIDRVHLAK